MKKLFLTKNNWHLFRITSIINLTFTKIIKIQTIKEHKLSK